jgi:hypothetical protein
MDAANRSAADLCIASASFGSSLDAGLSTSTIRLEMVESETSADEFAWMTKTCPRLLANEEEESVATSTEEQAEEAVTLGITRSQRTLLKQMHKI